MVFGVNPNPKHSLRNRCEFGQSLSKTALTEVLERLLHLLGCESQRDPWRQQRSAQPVVIVVAKYAVCSKGVSGLTL